MLQTRARIVFYTSMNLVANFFSVHIVYRGIHCINLSQERKMELVTSKAESIYMPHIKEDSKDKNEKELCTPTVLIYDGTRKANKVSSYGLNN